MKTWKIPTLILLLLLTLSARFGISQSPNSSLLTGQLVDPAGKPLPDTKMCLCTRRMTIWNPSLPMDDPKNPDPSLAFSTTDSTGHFSFPTPPKPANLLAFTDTGYVIAKSKSFTTPLIITLTPWATIKGIVKIGDQPAPAGIFLQANCQNEAISDELGPWPSFSTQTDAHGQFTFGHVLAGDYRVFRSDGLPISVTVAAGKTSEITLPILGRDVHGTFTLPPEVDTTDWYAQVDLIHRFRLPKITLPAKIQQMTPAERLAWYDHWETQTPEGQQHIQQRKLARERTTLSQLAPNNSFAFSDVRPGPTTLRVFFYPHTETGIAYEHQITVVAYDCNVPAVAGIANLKPLELGALHPRPAEITNADQLAPDILFPTLDGSEVQLSQLRGKVVLLQFWSSIDDMPTQDALSEIYETFSPDSHFTMLSLGIRADRAALEKDLAISPRAWPQGYLGSADQAWPAKIYCPTGFPSFWLIGPDGKVLAEGFQARPLIPSIDKALKNIK